MNARLLEFVEDNQLQQSTEKKQHCYYLGSDETHTHTEKQCQCRKEMSICGGGQQRRLLLLEASALRRPVLFVPRSPARRHAG